jgi:hypothetical protein
MSGDCGWWGTGQRPWPHRGNPNLRLPGGWPERLRLPLGRIGGQMPRSRRHERPHSAPDFIEGHRGVGNGRECRGRLVSALMEGYAAHHILDTLGVDRPSRRVVGLLTFERAQGMPLFSCVTAMEPLGAESYELFSEGVSRISSVTRIPLHSFSSTIAASRIGTSISPTGRADQTWAGSEERARSAVSSWILLR